MNSSHGSFYMNIANRYGTVWLTKVKEFVRLRIKRKKLECSLDYVVKCRDSDVIPKFARIKQVNCIRDCDKFFHSANVKLLRRIVTECRQKLMFTNKKLYELHLTLPQVISQDLWEVLDGMSYNRTHSIENDMRERHANKFNKLQLTACKSQRYPLNKNATRVIAHSADNVVNLSSHELSENAIRALSHGLNFAPTPRKIPVESIITAIESTVMNNKIPHQDAECIRQDISSMLRKSKPPKANIDKAEIQSLRDLSKNKDILVLPADKGNATVVVDTNEYEKKIEDLISDNTVYKSVNYNPTLRLTNKVVKLLQNSENKEMLTRLRPHNPTSPKLYGLPKIHKPGWPLRPIVSQIDAPTYKLSKHLASILQPLTGKTSSHIKNSRHFVQLLAEINIEPTEIMVSFDVGSLFTNIPVEETIAIITNHIKREMLPIEYVDWARLCLTGGYFMWRGEHYLQIDGVAMGSPIAPVAANIYMEWFENTALTTTSDKPRYWWRYVDDVFAIIDREMLFNFTTHLNAIHERIQFTVEEEKDGELSFLDVRVMRLQDGRLSHAVYRKPSHTDRYLRADSHHHHTHLSSVPRALINRALSLCDSPYIDMELDYVRTVLENNGYNWRQCTRWMNASEKARPVVVERAPVYLPFVKGVTDKIGYLLKRRYNIKTIFRPHTQLKQILRSPKDKEPLSGPGVYKIPCDCGACYIGETKRNVATRLTEHIRSIKNRETSKSAVAAHALNEETAHFIRFDKASVLTREKYFVPRKVREAIEISRHKNNFNRDGGWMLPPAWKPILNVASKNVESFVREIDTVGILCGDPTTIRRDEDDVTSDRLQAPAPRPTPRASPRTRRARARSLRAALTRTGSP